MAGSQNLYNRLLPETIRTLAAASVPSSTANPAWVKIGTALTNPSRILVIQNFTDKTLSFSWDGSANATTGVTGNINLQLMSNGQIVIDETAAGTPQASPYTAQGTQFWVQYPNAAGAPTTGAVNISTIYATGTSI